MPCACCIRTKETGVADEKKPVGLFATNYGTIGNLKLDNVQITSPGDYVGSFAGITVYGKNLTGETAGILENLEVVNDDVDAETASFVKGKSYVGGITGTLIADSDSVVSAVTWKELSNAAKVTDFHMWEVLSASFDREESVNSHHIGRL